MFCSASHSSPAFNADLKETDPSSDRPGVGASGGEVGGEARREAKVTEYAYLRKVMDIRRYYKFINEPEDGLDS